MGQTSSTNSLLSRKSNKSTNSNASSKSFINSSTSSLKRKLIRTSALTEELIFTPRTSAHQAFRKYSIKKSSNVSVDTNSNSTRSRRSTSCSSGGDSVHVEIVSFLIQIDIKDVENIKSSWSTVENHLCKIGVKIFVLLFESQPELKRKFRGTRCKDHCELRMNEDFQKHVLYLMGGIKRIVKYFNANDPKSLNRYLRRLAKKHNTDYYNNYNGLDLVFLLNAQDFGTVFCTAIKQTINCLDNDTEKSWMSFFESLMNTLKTLTNKDLSERSVTTPKERSTSALLEVSDTESSSSSVIKNTFDRHLVLVGCQTFQEFFDRHPEVLEHFDKFSAMEIDKVKVSEALRMHASRVLAIVEDIVENTGNPDKIRSMLQDLGRHHYQQGITREHLEMLGPLLCHTIRPLVFTAGLWSIEVEKSWTHLFDMVATLMKRGYPEQSIPSSFPSLTHTLILKDTWGILIEQMHSLGLTTFVKLFKLNANLKYYYGKDNRPNESSAIGEDVNRHFERLISVLDDIIRGLPNFSSHIHALQRLGESHKASDVDSRLLALMGPVFCNTVRPLFLVQGRWSYTVESSWLLLFRHIAAFMCEGYEMSKINREMKKDEDEDIIKEETNLLSRELSASSKSL